MAAHPKRMPWLGIALAAGVLLAVVATLSKSNQLSQTPSLVSSPVGPFSSVREDSAPTAEEEASEPAGAEDQVLTRALDLAHSNLAAAAEWIDGHCSRSARDDYLATVILEAAREHPQEAYSHITRLSQPESQVATVDCLFANWSSRDFDQAFLAAAGENNPLLKPAALAATLRVKGEAEPESALLLAKEHLGGTYDFDRLAVTVLQTWSERTPEPALNWVVLNLGEQVRKQVLGTTLPRWAKSHPEEATGWVQKLASASIRREALIAIGAGASI